ncbi:MAG: PilW family protein [Candidatus Geothermincolia bacterium]
MKISRLVRKTRESVAGDETGFTIVELLIVMIVSIILIAGMVGLVDMSMKQLNRGRAVAAVADASRRALASMDRQIKQALFFDDTQCSASVIAFWGDIDNDNSTADVDTYTTAEYVRFYRSGTTITEEVTEPGGGGTTFNTLCGNVSSLAFHYFAQGVRPDYDPGSGTYTNELTSNYNESAGLIKVSVGFSRATIQRNFEQDIFLRILDRTP